MSDRDGKVEPLTINIVPGSMAPRFEATTHELTALGVTITEQGMKSGLPLIDFKFVDAEGRHFAFTTSGRMVLALAGAIMGVNVRNHGKPDP